MPMSPRGARIAARLAAAQQAESEAHALFRSPPAPSVKTEKRRGQDGKRRADGGATADKRGSNGGACEENCETPQETVKKTVKKRRTALRPRTWPSWIAGLAYERRDEYVRAYLKAGDDLGLYPEPDNPHDSEAIALTHAGYKIGYVPARHDWIWRALQEGDLVTVTVRSIETDEDDPELPHVWLDVTVIDAT